MGGAWPMVERMRVAGLTACMKWIDEERRAGGRA